ncbi:amidase [Alphaproteobacteria bacterium]|nr:amidase [Alphaproteobacteria bacterium]
MKHKILYKNNERYKHLVSIPKDKDLERFNKESSDFFGIKLVDNPLTFTVKDIFNTYVFPTEMGSPLWKGHIAGNNARVVSSALQAGHKLIAKTVTSEFAVHEPTKVINPWNSKFQTGTSSAGSAVSVFLKECDYSLATQTAGSISRPAAYCGVIGVKPSFGLLPRTGVLKTCDAFDTVGFMLSATSNLSEIFDTLRVQGKNYPNTTLLDKYNVEGKNSPIRIARIDNNFDKNVKFSNNSINALSKTCSILRENQCEIIDEVQWPEFIQEIRESHDQIYSRSLLYYFKTEVKEEGEISNSFKEIIKRGEGVTAEDFIKLIKKHQVNIKKFDMFMKENKIDFIVCPTVYGCAPKIDEDEKPDLNLIWTYLHVPTVTLPIGKDKLNKLPLGTTLVGQKYSDKFLFELADKCFNNEKNNND